MRASIQKLRTWTSRLGEHPPSGWHFMLACLVVSIVVVLAIDGAMSLRLLSDEIGSSPESIESTLIIDRKKISDVADDIRQKEIDAAAISPALLRDPSI